MVALTPWTSLIEADQRGGLVHMFGRTLILILVALLALGALSIMAFTPDNIAITQNDEVVERDDSYDLYGVSDDDDDSGNAPTNDTGSDGNTSGEWSNGSFSDHSTYAARARNLGFW
jgi:hypothetical protein